MYVSDEEKSLAKSVIVKIIGVIIIHCTIQIACGVALVNVLGWYGLFALIPIWYISYKGLDRLAVKLEEKFYKEHPELGRKNL